MSRKSSEKTTPMMAQYQKLKTECPDAILFYRLGDFYEMFGEDAIEASKLLEITLTARGSGEGRANKIPMCGVPHHAAENYINRLIKAGKKVAVVEQTEDPKKTKGMVKRELVRTITPGTKLSPESLDAKQNNYLVALTVSTGIYGLAATDLSTGEFLVTEFSGTKAAEEIVTELGRLNPAEVLIPDDLNQSFKNRLQSLDRTYITNVEGFRFDVDAGRIQCQSFFNVVSLDGFGCGDLSAAVGAASAALHYLTTTQKGALSHVKKMQPYSIKEHMGLDDATIRNLELVRNLVDSSKKYTLIETLDYTLTAMGGRRLYTWVLRPLISVEKIQHRQATVAELVASSKLRQALEDELNQVYDIERLAGRIGAGTASPRDLASLRNTLRKLPDIKTVLQGTDSSFLKLLSMELPECKNIATLLETALVDEPPLTLKDGGVFKEGFNAEIDEYRTLTKQGKQFITDMQIRERERTGINTLKVEYNNVFGYYIEVTKANAKLVPENYHRKQTLVNAERYITPELKEYEQKVLGAQDKLIDLEQRLFQELKLALIHDLEELLQTAGMVADLDALYALASAAVRNNYSRPTLDDSGHLEIIDGRHPVVEQLVEDQFVPNDVVMDDEKNQVLIITGPNMAGKSTYLRQNALIVIMAQMGGFVPAQKAHIGIIDRVFTRVGAADNLAGGQSTFMVEMNETANILNNATERSLVILDEVGRGTSTFDGVSIAWSVAEYLHDHVKTKTLFATHYYELTELTLSMDRVQNFNIAVKEWKDEIIFLRKIVAGSTDRSYGIQVARLAGLPDAVIHRSREILTNLEKANYTESGNSRLAFHLGQETETEQQASLFTQEIPHDGIIEELDELDINQMTPMDALNRLVELQKKIKKSV